MNTYLDVSPEVSQALAEGKPVLVGEFSERAVYGSDRVGGVNEQRLHHDGNVARDVKSADFRRTAADIDADNYFFVHRNSVQPPVCGGR